MNFGIDLLRHIFAVAVIMQHMTSASRYSAATNQGLASAVDWIDGAVIGFFLISGFLFKQRLSLMGYWRRQTIRLLVPFFIFSLIYAIALAAIGKGNLVEGLKNTVLLHGSGMQLYYLPYLLVVTGAFAALNQNLRKHRILILCVLTLLALSTAIVLPTSSSTGSDIKLIPFYFSAFLIGVVIAEHFRRGLHIAAAFAVGMLGLAIGCSDTRFFDLAGVISLLGVALALAPKFPSVRLPGSGGIYLLHTPIVNFAISTLLFRVSITQTANIVFSIALTYLICLGTTLLTMKVFPQHRWLILE